MKKQIAFVTRKMQMGGVEKALISMVKQFDFDQWDVDIIVQSPGGELINDLPAEVSVIHLQTVSNRDFLEHPLLCWKKAILALLLKVFKLPYIYQCFLSSRMYLPIEKKYDIAVSYHAPNTVPVFFTADYMRAKKKVLWLHGDIKNNQGFYKIAEKYYKRYDQVFAVSKYVLNTYIEKYSFRHQNTGLFYNYVDLEYIRLKAEEKIVFDKSIQNINIVSVGRLTKQKGFDLAIKACKRIIDEGYPIHWFICGDGEEKKQLEKMIDKYNLKNSFFLLGNIMNPYPYIKNCDIYVQPSRSEGYCTSTNEARMLNKPVVTTEISGAREQFEDGLTGWIVPIDEEAIAKKIMWCIDNPEIVNKVQDSIQVNAPVSDEALNLLLEF